MLFSFVFVFFVLFCLVHSFVFSVSFFLLLAFSFSSTGPENHGKWTERIMEEFFQQGDNEKSLGVTVSAFMDREKMVLDFSHWPHFPS
jgi:hypothetical protein